MSKSKQAKFHLRAKETVLRRGMMDYGMTGGYNHFVQGDAVLTNERFHFEAELTTGELVTFEIPLGEIYAVEKAGIPFLTRSMMIYTDGHAFRLNAVFVGRWVKSLKEAIAAMEK